MVSAVLQREGAPDTIRLLHAQIVASGQAGAMRLMLRQATNDYPGYVVLDMIASPIVGKPAARSASADLRT